MHRFEEFVEFLFLHIWRTMCWRQKEYSKYICWCISKKNIYIHNCWETVGSGQNNFNWNKEKQKTLFWIKSSCKHYWTKNTIRLISYRTSTFPISKEDDCDDDNTYVYLLDLIKYTIHMCIGSHKIYEPFKIVYYLN